MCKIKGSAGGAAAANATHPGVVSLTETVPARPAREVNKCKMRVARFASAGAAHPEVATPAAATQANQASKG